VAINYDLIVIGGGPAGMMAAKTAAEDGLEVLLIERKNDITATPRTDVSIFYWKFLIADEYLEPIDVRLGTGVPMQTAGRGGVDVKTQFHFLGPEFSIDYTGPVIPYYDYIKLSPSGYRVYCIKDELWGFYFSREIILADLLTAVQKTKAEVLTGTIALGVENTQDGVNVRVRTKSGEQVLKARKVIAADGINSKTVDSLGLNQNRQTRPFSVVGYILDGVEPEVYNHGTWLSFDIPSLSLGPVYMGFHAEAGALNFRHLIADSEKAIETFMNHTKYAPWFRRARLVRKTAFSGSLNVPLLSKPVEGNVLIIGDAIDQESFIQGAIACGYQGAKATIKELNGQKGYPEYTNWLHKAFAFYHPGHFQTKSFGHVFRMALPNDDDIDYIFRIMQEQGMVKLPATFIAKNPELVKDGRPEFYYRLKNAINEIDRMAAKGEKGYSIYKKRNRSE